VRQSSRLLPGEQVVGFLMNTWTGDLLPGIIANDIFKDVILCLE